jgi:hypothetical protein
LLNREKDDDRFVKEIHQKYIPEGISVTSVHRWLGERKPGNLPSLLTLSTISAAVLDFLKHFAAEIVVADEKKGNDGTSHVLMQS